MRDQPEKGWSLLLNLKNKTVISFKSYAFLCIPKVLCNLLINVCFFLDKLEDLLHNNTRMYLKRCTE